MTYIHAVLRSLCDQMMPATLQRESGCNYATISEVFIFVLIDACGKHLAQIYLAMLSRIHNCIVIEQDIIIILFT